MCCFMVRLLLMSSATCTLVLADKNKHIVLLLVCAMLSNTVFIHPFSVPLPALLVIAGLVAAKTRLQQDCPGTPVAQHWFGSVYDGMNTQGLSAAVQTQKDAPAPSILQLPQQQQQQEAGVANRVLRQFSTSTNDNNNKSNNPNDKINLVYMDLMPLLLGNFKSVAEAVAAITPDKFQLMSTEQVACVEDAIMGGGRKAAVLHTIIHDAQVSS
jgi:penicillin V acylase-like amidase (Ntn superfamily)